MRGTAEHDAKALHSCRHLCKAAFALQDESARPLSAPPAATSPTATCALQDEWRQTITHIELRHIGKFTFKGIPQPQAVWQINSKRLSGRSFPAAAASAKAQRAEEGIGLVFCITFEDNEVSA